MPRGRSSLIEYRPFLNTDPPHLVEIWRAQPPTRGLAQPITVGLLETCVLGKPYFDRSGFIVAVEDGQPVGFAHASFGARDDGADLDFQWGVTSLVMVRPNQQRQGIGDELLRRSEAYLRDRGAKVLYAGGIRPLNGFYVGLYGGSELPGVLASSLAAQTFFQRHGYHTIDETIVLQLELDGFRPPISQKQFAIRRATRVETTHDPPSASWWEACTSGGFDRIRYDLWTKDQTRLATATFWDMRALAQGWGVHAVGLVDVATEEPQRRKGYAQFLLGEALQQQQKLGMARVEVQTMRNNAAALALYERLHFREVDRGAVLRKDAP